MVGFLGVMKIIYNKYFPQKPFYAINIFCIVFVRKGGGKLSARDINHEAIHSAQMKELLFIPFYTIYLLEWFWGLLKYRDALKSYRNISFEREAYANETNLNYLSNRSLWASFYYFTSKTKPR